MNTAELYNRATGREKEEKESTEDEKLKSESKAILAEQYRNWLNTFETVDFIEFLESYELQLKDYAANMASVSPIDSRVARNLIKAKTVKEILTYLKNKNKPTIE